MPTLKIKVTPDAEMGQTEVEEPKTRGLQIKLEARKTLDGKIMVMDHRDIDIIIDTSAKKIITFPKKEMSDEAYDSQDKYFRYLAENGIVNRDSIHAGNVYASIEATYPESHNEDVSPAQVVLLSTYKFIQEEKPRFEADEWYENEVDDYYSYPTEEDSTELGEVPEEPKKGSLSPYGGRRYMTGYASQ